MPLIIPDPRWETMELMYPGRKPIGSVALNPENKFGFNNPIYCVYEGREIVQGGEGIDSGTGLSIGIQPGVGKSLKGTGGGYRYYSPVPLLTGSEVTLLLHYVVDSLTANDVLFHHSVSSTSITEGLVVWVDSAGYNSGNPNCLSLQIDNVRAETDADSLVVGEIATVVLVWRGGADITAYKNGEDINAVFYGGAPTVFSGTQSIMRLMGAGTLDNFTGGCDLAALQLTAISDAAARELSLDPYQIFLPA